jgi:N-methylhydantoinase B
MIIGRKPETMPGQLEPEFDSITLEIMWNRLISIADQAATTLVRTSFSTIVRECNDYACVLMDRNGDTLAENRGAIPSLVGTLSRTMKHFLRRFPPQTWRPGDVVITNDPWMGTGHRPDFTMTTPVFRDGELAAFTGIIAHASDIGGAIFSADSRSVFEEGLGIPPMKLFSEGIPNEELFELIRYNVRVPEQVTGDFMAMVAGCEISGRQLLAFMDEYGGGMLEALSRNIQARAEGVMRRAISRLPDGTYSHTVSLDGFDKPVRIACAITIRGDSLEVDFAGTSEQLEQGGINVVNNYTWAFTTYPQKCILAPLTYRNEGSYRPFTIAAPEGSILNATYPKAVSSRHLTGHCITSAVFGALAPVLPEMVIADSGSTPQYISFFAGVDGSARPFSLMLFLSGGMGASSAADGPHCSPFPSNPIPGSVEVMEAVAPLIVWQKELAQDSGGPGRFRGGCGQDVRIEVTSPQRSELSMMSERWDFPPEGLHGGLPGSRSGAVKVAPDGRSLPRKGRTILEPRDVTRLSIAGGAGFGPPAGRDVERVIEDLRNGIISEEAARTVYGLDQQGGQ